MLVNIQGAPDLRDPAVPIVYATPLSPSTIDPALAVVDTIDITSVDGWPGYAVSRNANGLI